MIAKGDNMSSENIVTLNKMMESLPISLQAQVIEHLREYIDSLQDEMEWDSLTAKTQDKLVNAAKKAKQEIAEGKAKPMDYNQL